MFNLPRQITALTQNRDNKNNIARMLPTNKFLLPAVDEKLSFITIFWEWAGV